MSNEDPGGVSMCVAPGWARMPMRHRDLPGVPEIIMAINPGGGCKSPSWWFATLPGLYIACEYVPQGGLTPTLGLVIMRPFQGLLDLPGVSDDGTLEGSSRYVDPGGVSMCVTPGWARMPIGIATSLGSSDNMGIQPRRWLQIAFVVVCNPSRVDVPWVE